MGALISLFSCSHRPLFSVHRRQERSRQLLFCRWVFPKCSTKKTHRRSIVCGSCDATNFFSCKQDPTRSWRCAWRMNNMSSFHPCCSSVAACFHFHLLVSPRQARRTKRWTPLIITWPPKEHEVLLLDRFLLFLLCWHLHFFVSSLRSNTCCGCSRWKCGRRFWVVVPSMNTPERILLAGQPRASFTPQAVAAGTALWQQAPLTLDCGWRRVMCCLLPPASCTWVLSPVPCPCFVSLFLSFLGGTPAACPWHLLWWWSNWRRLCRFPSSGRWW